MGAEEDGYCPVATYGWCWTDYLAPLGSEDALGRRELLAACSLTNHAVCPTWGSGGGIRYHRGELLTGAQLVCERTKGRSTLACFAGWISVSCLTNDSTAIVIPEEFRVLSIDSDSDSTYFTGLIRNPCPMLELGSFVRCHRLVVFDRASNPLYMLPFSLGSRSQATQDRECLRFRKSIPLPRSAFVTFRIVGTESKIQGMYK